MKLEAGQQVNRLGKYLKKHIDSIYKISFSPNMCDLYMYMYYQKLPFDEVKEMIFNINITTYQSKVRINIIEVTPEERTIGFDLYTPDKLENLAQSSKLVYDKIVSRISHAYADYDFVF